jgi:hypothetical protein
MLIKNIFLLAALFLTNPVHGQAPFQNLDFESATVPDIPQGTSGSEVSVNEALPSWTVSSGQEPVLLVFHNQVASGSSIPSLFGPQYPTPQIAEGKYSLLLNPGVAPDQSLSQTGFVPSDSRSILFEAGVGEIRPGTATLGSIPLTVVALRYESTYYTTYGADISGLAGRTEELRFTAFHGGGMLLDNIRFSTLVIAEPGNTTIFVCGLAVFGLIRARRRSVD